MDAIHGPGAPLARPLPPRPTPGTAPLAAPPTRPLEPATTHPAATSDPALRPLSCEPAYQELAMQGRLTPLVLEGLLGLLRAPLAPGLERMQLMRAALADLAQPCAIRQGAHETCAAAVLQAKLAQDHPVRYLALLRALASPGGQGTLPDGSLLVRAPGALATGDRSLSAALWQPALMQAASTGYDVAHDRRADGAGAGLYADEQARVLERLTGTAQTVVGGSAGQAAAAAWLRSGQSVPAILTLPDPAGGTPRTHALLLERLQGDQVQVLDPQGQRHTVPWEALAPQLASFTLPAASAPPAASAARGRLAGAANWWSGALGAVLGGAAAVAQAVAGPIQAVVQPIQAAATATGTWVQERAVEAKRAVAETGLAIAGGLAAAGNTVVQGIERAGDAILPGAGQLLGHGLRFTGEVARHTVQATVQGVQRVTGAVVDAARWVDQNKGWLSNVVGGLAMAVPGFQVVALVLAVASGWEALTKIHRGLEQGDWEVGLDGVKSLAEAAAQALGLKILGGLLGPATATVARLCGTTATLLGGAAQFRRSSDLANPDAGARQRGAMGGVVAMAKGLGGFLGGGFQEAAETFGGLHDKLMAVEQAIRPLDTHGRPQDPWTILLAGLGVGSALTGALDDQTEATAGWKQVSGTLGQARRGLGTLHGLTTAPPGDPVTNARTLLQVVQELATVLAPAGATKAPTGQAPGEATKDPAALTPQVLDQLLVLLGDPGHRQEALQALVQWHLAVHHDDLDTRLEGQALQWVEGRLIEGERALQELPARPELADVLGAAARTLEQVEGWLGDRAREWETALPELPRRTLPWVGGEA